MPLLVGVFMGCNNKASFLCCVCCHGFDGGAALGDIILGKSRVRCLLGASFSESCSAV